MAHQQLLRRRIMMEDPLYLIDIIQDGNIVTARVKTQEGRRQFSSFSVEGVLEQLINELADEY